MIRSGCVRILVLILTCGNVVADAVREFPCVSCVAYDHGWLHAANSEYRDLEDCDFDPIDEWAEDFIEGCEDYVRKLVGADGVFIAPAVVIE